MESVVKMDFAKFKRAVALQYDRLQKHDLFVAQVDNDALWALYLSSFPPGTNPEFRKPAGKFLSQRRGCMSPTERTSHGISDRRRR